jgi:hypothetical protein
LVNTTFEIKKVSWSSLEAYENETFIVKKSNIIKFQKRLWMYWTWVIKILRRLKRVGFLEGKTFQLLVFHLFFKKYFSDPSKFLSWCISF